MESSLASSRDSQQSAGKTSADGEQRFRKSGKALADGKQQALMAKALSRSADLSQSLDDLDPDQFVLDDLLFAVCGEDELRDLAFTFTACDIDNSSSMEVDELQAMLVMQCNTITEEQVDSLMRAGKKHYEEWHAESASDYDHEFLVDRMMKAAGLNIGNRTKHGAVRTFAALDFQEKQVGAAQLLDTTVSKAAAALDHTVDSTVHLAADAMDKTGARALGAKGVDRFQSSIGKAASRDSQEHSSLPSAGASLEGLTQIEDVLPKEEELSLSFPEYVFTMKCQELEDLMDFDAHTLAMQMRAFRNAFSAVDVDGQNLLEYDDLEIVTLTLNPRLLLKEDDLLGLWQVVTKHAIVEHAARARREAAEEVQQQQRQAVTRVDQKLIALDDDEAQLEKRLKLRYVQEITPKEENWIRNELARVSLEREGLLEARQDLIDKLLKPEPPKGTLEPEPEPTPDPESAVTSLVRDEKSELREDGAEEVVAVVQVVQIEGLMKCQYGRTGKFETVWLSVANDGTMDFRDTKGMPPGVHASWQGPVLRTANAVQSSVRDIKRLRGKNKMQGLKVDLVAPDDCGEDKYAMRSTGKKSKKDWLKLRDLRKTLQSFAVLRWDDCKAVTLNFNEFLHGMAAAQQDERTAQWINVFEPNRWELLSLIIDTPVSEIEEEAIYRSMSAVEQVGVDILRRKRQDMDMERIRMVLTKAANGALSKLDAHQFDKMRSLHRGAVLSCAIVGLVFAAMAASLENGLQYALAIDGFKDTYWVCTVESQLDIDPNSPTFGLVTPIFPDLANPDEMLCSTVHVNASTCTDHFLDRATVASTGEYYPPGHSPRDMRRDDNFGWTTLKPVDDTMVEICGACECAVCGCATHAPVLGRVEMDSSNKQLLFWGILTPTIIVTVLIEIAMLLYFAMRYTTLVAWALDFRLTPLNKDRAFVAGSLIRAAFEMGNPDSPLLGVDPHQEGGGGSTFLVVIVFKLKVFLTGLAVKIVIGLLAPAHVALWVKPWLGMVLSTIAWDGYTCHSLMIQARIRGFGVYTSVELFNDIMDTTYSGITNVAATISFFAKVQIARSIGVAIVIHGSLHPSMELLLRHSLQYLHLVGTRVVAQTGILDNREGFLQDLAGDVSHINPIFSSGDEKSGDEKRSGLESWMGSRDSRDDVDTLSREDQVAVLSVHLLAFVLDGYLDPGELEIWESVCSAVGPQVAAYRPDKVLNLCRRFSAMQTITAKELRECYEP